MSILNFSCTRSRVLLAVDTLAGMEGRPRFEVTKLIGLAHLNALVAVRGRQDFFHTAVGRCLGFHWASFDALLDGAHTIVAEAHHASDSRQVQHAQQTWQSSALFAAMGGDAPPIGGRLLVAELTRDRLTVECVVELTARADQRT